MHKRVLKKQTKLDALDSRLFKKELLRLVRVRKSILLSACGSYEKALNLAKAAPERESDPFHDDVEQLIWKWVAASIEIEMRKI